MREIQSLARGLKILNLLGQSKDGVSITELAEILEVDKSSASRLASTLANYGYAKKDPATQRYHLGPRILTLGRHLIIQPPLRDVAKPFLIQLMEQTGECSHLALPAQGEALCIDQVESPATLRVNIEIGQYLPLHCTALGKAVLAFGDLQAPVPLERYTPHTILDLDELNQHIETIRQQGYAMDDEEYGLGVRCLAVPVYDFQASLAGAIGISGPALRMTPEKIPGLAAIVQEVGKALSNRMASVHS
jgi:IclR family KDG regulon transcriptional repressor